MPLLSRPVSGGILSADYSEDGVILRLDLVHAAFIFLAAFLVYFWSASRTVGLEDDGYFILAAYYNGIAHPPGYPLYTLLAHLATLVPAGSIALRVHLLSGFLGALACACLWCIARILIRDRAASWAVALALAFSKVFWSQALIAEVYTLNVFLILTTFLCVLAVRNGGAGRVFGRPVKLLFLCYGLALSNHWPLVLLTTPMFIAALWQVRNRICQVVMSGLPFLLLGLTPYLWMAIRSQMDPEIVFFGPVETFSDFWHYLGRT
ncbi:MAG: glycosyltransferase family 117 protein, partial [Gammaproteobacteria bacterium]